MGGMKLRTVRMKSLMAEARNRIAKDLERQSRALREQMAGLEKMVAQAEEAIWTISLYLGTSETIVRLADGEAAPAETPITIVQTTRYMDEESAIAANEGGMDFRNIEDFDAWVIQPEHLHQVLPFPRGIVAIKPRRMSKEYTGDPLVDAKLNEENHRTYFLLRNGGKVFRIDTALRVGSNLTPRLHEFADLFEEKVWDHDCNDYVKRPMRAGSRAYSEALERAEGMQRHYMRIMLFLQGLLDRTPIFQPLPAPRINILDARNQDRYIHFFNDLDEDRMLPAPHPPFREWLRTVNSELEVGHRVIGCFDNWEHGLRIFETERNSYRNTRLRPSRARMPKNDVLHTIEGREGKYLLFRYAREGEERWDDYEGDFVAYEKRAACLLNPREDRFILNFDAATVEDMEFYLRSRMNRSEYSYLHPVLQTAIRLKRQEKEEEAPFRAMMTGVIMRDYGAEADAVEAEIDDLIAWWKFKNKTHRALLSDDVLAVRMISDEWRLRREREAAREKYDCAAVVAHVLANAPVTAGFEPILVAHKGDNQFVALVPENDQNVFFREQTWTATLRGRMRLAEDRRWRVMADNRWKRWHLLHTSERWAAWKLRVSAAAYLTDPEVFELLESAAEKAPDIVRQRNGERAYSSDFRNSAPTPNRRCVPLSFVFDTQEQRMYAWVFANTGRIPAKHLLTGRWFPPRMFRITFAWKREGDQVQAVYHDYSPYTSFQEPELVDSWEGRRRTRDASARVMWIDPEAVQRVRRIYARHQAAEQEKNRLERGVQRLAARARERVRALDIEAEFARFMIEYGDEELWEGHLKSIKLPELPALRRLERALRFVVEGGNDVDGMTVQAVIRQAHAAKMLNDPKDDEDTARLPMDFVFRVQQGDFATPPAVPWNAVSDTEPEEEDDDDTDDEDEDGGDDDGEG